jgi:hypothetical protein
MTATFLTFKPIRALTNAKRVIIKPARADRSVLSAVNTETSALPNTSALPQIVLRGRIAPGWYIWEPLQLLVEQDMDDSFIVSDALFDMYGVGKTNSEAIDDYVTSLLEYYEILSAHAGDNDQASVQLDRLKLYLLPISE